MYENVCRIYDQHELYFAFPGLDEILDLFNDYIEDKITIDSAIEHIQQIIHS